MYKRKISIVKEKTQAMKKRKMIEEKLNKKYKNLKKNEKLEFIPIPSSYGYATTLFRKKVRLCEIFFRFFTFELLMELIDRSKKEFKKDFFKNKGNDKFSEIKINLREIIYYLAARIYIHSKKPIKITNKKKRNIELLFLDFNNFLLEKKNEKIKIIPHKKLHFIHTHLYIKSGTHEEDALFENIRDCLKNFGEVFIGDEKLFSFRGKSEFLRYCPSKPTEIGLWNYQAVVQLSTEKYLLIYSKLYRKNEENNKPTDILKKWGEIILGKKNKSILFFDSYYMSEDSLNFLKKNNIRYIASGSKAKNKNLYDLLRKKVNNKNYSSLLYNRKESEAVSLVRLNQNPLVEKITFSNSFRIQEKMLGDNDGQPPLFYEYKAFFNGCDLFNHDMARRFFSNSSRSSHDGGDILANWNYLFTSVLQNIYNIYLDLNYKKRKNLSFCDFCEELAIDLINYIVQNKES